MYSVVTFLLYGLSKVFSSSATEKAKQRNRIWQAKAWTPSLDLLHVHERFGIQTLVCFPRFTGKIFNIVRKNFIQTLSVVTGEMQYV